MDNRKRKRDAYDDCYFDIEEDILYRLHYSQKEKKNKNRHNAFLNLNRNILAKVIPKHGGLEVEDLSRVMQTSKLSYSIFKPLFNEGAQFLQKVAFGQQDEAEKMIKRNPKLMLEKNNVTDYSHRTFHAISALQYCAWARDIYMLEMLLSYLPKEEKKTAYQQFHALDQYGTEYGSSYEPKLLIEALREFMDHRKDWTTEQKRESFAKIAYLQFKLPAHGAHEYNQPKNGDLRFGAQRTFTEQVPLPRNVYITDLNGYDVSWYEEKNTDTRMPIGTTIEHFYEDAFALELLFTVRTNTYHDIKSNLLKKCHDQLLYNK